MLMLMPLIDWLNSKTYRMISRHSPSIFNVNSFSHCLTFLDTVFLHEYIIMMLSETEIPLFSHVIPPDHNLNLILAVMPAILMHCLDNIFPALLFFDWVLYSHDVGRQFENSIVIIECFFAYLKPPVISGSQR